MRQQRIVGKAGQVWLRSLSCARALGHGVRRGVIRGAAVASMLVIYGVTSIGAPLGVAGVSGLALSATATPANAWRRRRRHRWFRGYRGYRGWGWGHRRRRRRRHRGFSLYLNI